MSVVIHVNNPDELPAKLAAVLDNVMSGLTGSLRQTSTNIRKKISKKMFEETMVELAARAGEYAKQLLSQERLAQTNLLPDESQRMLPQHDVDWRALDNLAHYCLLHSFSSLNEYLTLLHKYTVYAAETGEHNADALPHEFQLAIMEQQSQHLAYTFIVHSHVELCSEYGRNGSALLHLDRIRSQVEERAQHRVITFKQSLEAKKNAQTEGRGKKKTNKSVARKVDRSNVSDKGRNQRGRKGHKGVEAKKVKTRNSRAAKVRAR